MFPNRRLAIAGLTFDPVYADGPTILPPVGSLLAARDDRPAEPADSGGRMMVSGS